MKRDDDFLRQMLMSFEESNDDMFIIGGPMSMPTEERKREYHARLACDAGLLIEANRSVFRMTNQGHDYLDAIRDEGIWKSTKEMVAETGGSATLEIVKCLALGLLKQKIAKHTGFDL